MILRLPGRTVRARHFDDLQIGIHRLADSDTESEHAPDYQESAGKKRCQAKHAQKRRQDHIPIKTRHICFCLLFTPTLLHLRPQRRSLFTHAQSCPSQPTLDRTYPPTHRASDPTGNNSSSCGLHSPREGYPSASPNR